MGGETTPYHWNLSRMFDGGEAEGFTGLWSGRGMELEGATAAVAVYCWIVAYCERVRLFRVYSFTVLQK